MPQRGACAVLPGRMRLPRRVRIAGNRGSISSRDRENQNGRPDGKCPKCGLVRVARDGVLDAECPACAQANASAAVMPATETAAALPFTAPVFAGKSPDLTRPQIVIYTAFAGLVLFTLVKCNLAN